MSVEQQTCAVRLINPKAGEAISTPDSAQTIMREFLKDAVKPPYRYAVLSPNSFAVHGPYSIQELEVYILNLQKALSEHLYGQDESEAREALPFVGTDNDIANFLFEPESDAIQRSSRFFETARNRLRTNTSKNPVIWQNRDMLLYSGIAEMSKSAVFSNDVIARREPGSTSGTRTEELPSLLGYSLQEFEIFCLNTAADQIKEQMRSQKPLMFNCFINLETLTCFQHKKAFLEAAASLRDDLRRHIFLSVVNTGDRPNAFGLQRFCSEFSSLFRFLDWEVSMLDFDASQFKGIPIHSISYHLNRDIDVEGQIKRFGEHASSLKSWGVKTSLKHVSTKDELRQTIAAGIRYVSGRAVTKLSDQPFIAQKAGIEDVPLANSSLDEYSALETRLSLSA